MKRILVVFCLAHVLVTSVFAQCHAPGYRQGLTLTDSKSETLANISIHLQDFTPNKLVCLARTLKERYRGRQSVIVNIFSSRDAAKHSVGALRPEYARKDLEMLAQMHGTYLYDAEKHEDYVVLMPDPGISDPNAPTNTKFDLSTSTIPTCKLQIDERCLLEFGHIDSSSKSVPGTVTLTAQIERNGSVSDVDVVEADGNPSGHAVADLAVVNLKSWRYERSQNKSKIKIEYSLERVETPLEHGIKVQLLLPDKVKIQVGPLSLPHLGSAHPTRSNTGGGWLVQGLFGRGL